MQIPQHREPLQTALGRSLCFCFLSLCMHRSSLDYSFAGPGTERRVRHIPGERMQPSAEAAPCRKPFPLSFVGLFILFLFLQRNTIPHHHHQKSTVSLPDIDVCIIFVLFKEPCPWSLLLTPEVGWGREIIILGAHDMCARLCAAGLLCSAFL